MSMEMLITEQAHIRIEPHRHMKPRTTIKRFKLFQKFYAVDILVGYSLCPKLSLFAFLRFNGIQWPGPSSLIFKVAKPLLTYSKLSAVFLNCE